MVTLGYYPINVEQIEYHCEDEQHFCEEMALEDDRSANENVDQQHFYEATALEDDNFASGNVDKIIRKIHSTVPVIMNLVRSYAVRRLQSWWRRSLLLRELPSPNLSPVQSLNLKECMPIYERKCLQRKIGELMSREFHELGLPPPAQHI